MPEKFRDNRNHKPFQKPFDKSKGKHTSFNEAQSSLYVDFAEAYGKEYALINILQLAWPIHKVKLDVTVAAEPEDVLKDIHLILLKLVQNNINTYQSIAEFLGLEQNDFMLDELLELRKNNLVQFYDDKFHLTNQGVNFISGKQFIPSIEKKVFATCIDGVTNDVVKEYDIAKAEETGFQKIEPLCSHINYAFVEENWSAICACYKLENKGEEIIELSNGRQIGNIQMMYEPRYLMIFKGKQGEEEHIIKFKLVDKYRKESVAGSKGIEKIILKSPETFLQNLAGYEYTAPVKINEANPLQIKLNAISGFEHINFQEVDDYLRFALKHGRIVYMEVPRILRKARQFLVDIENFLKKENTKMYLIYGVSDDYQHDEDTVRSMKNLRKNYSNFIFIDLPEHAYSQGLKVSGVHNRIIIKDNDFYIETTYNFFTLDASRKEKISAETATIFNREVDAYFNKQKKSYHLK
jgi:hypothetical protein